MDEWIGCHYCSPYVRAYVYWTHANVDAERHTCFHCARIHGVGMRDKGWIRVTEEEWLTGADQHEKV